jgi:hypothetical protein
VEALGNISWTLILIGWDVNTGWPTRAKLEELGLKDIADELASIGKLPS